MAAAKLQTKAQILHMDRAPEPLGIKSKIYAHDDHDARASVCLQFATCQLAGQSDIIILVRDDTKRRRGRDSCEKVTRVTLLCPAQSLVLAILAAKTSKQSGKQFTHRDESRTHSLISVDRALHPKELSTFDDLSPCTLLLGF